MHKLYIFAASTPVISKANLRFFTSLQERWSRQESGLFVVEGLKALTEAVREQQTPEYLIQSASFKTTSPLFEEAEIISDSDFKRISSLKSPEGILGIFKIPLYPEEISFPAFALENIQDPGNVGTIIRIADWFGIPEVWCSPDTADPWQPKVVRSSMGSQFRVKVRVLENFTQQLSEHASKLQIAHMEGTSLNEAHFAPDSIFVLGNEGRGVSDALLQLPKVQKVFIPGKGEAESLNVGVAAGILAWSFENTPKTQS